MANDLFHEELEKYVLLEARKEPSLNNEHDRYLHEEICSMTGLASGITSLTGRLIECVYNRKISSKTHARFLRMKAHKAKKRLT